MRTCIIVASLASVACGGQVVGTEQRERQSEAPADPSTFAFCPTDEPAPTTACSDEGNRCVYYTQLRCEGAVECRNGRWVAIACSAATT